MVTELVLSCAAESPVIFRAASPQTPPTHVVSFALRMLSNLSNDMSAAAVAGPAGLLLLGPAEKVVQQLEGPVVTHCFCLLSCLQKEHARKQCTYYMLLPDWLLGTKQDCMQHDQVAAVSTVGLVLMLCAAAVCCA